MQLKIVLLPEPFGPIRPRLALVHLERDFVDGAQRAEPFGQPGDTQHCHAGFFHASERSGDPLLNPPPFRGRKRRWRGLPPP